MAHRPTSKTTRDHSATTFIPHLVRRHPRYVVPGALRKRREWRRERDAIETASVLCRQPATEKERIYYPTADADNASRAIVKFTAPVWSRAHVIN